MENKPKKGGLIKKQEKKPLLRPSVPVKKVQDDSFAYKAPSNKTKKSQKKTPLISKSESPVIKRSMNHRTNRRSTSLTTRNGRSIKIPEHILAEINLLGSFIDESVIYKILEELLDSYVQHELTDRQQRQFQFMLESFLSED